MLRRVHVPQIRLGKTNLDPQQAHHLLAVLRLENGAEIEAFDDAGNVAKAVLLTTDKPAIQIDEIEENSVQELPVIVIAAAVPKGDRADWMIEKLSELGVSRFIPLAAERSVVLPEGKNKMERWVRIAAESAKQSRRRGTMTIDRLTPLADAIRSAGAAGWFMSTAADATPIAELKIASRESHIFIGPEGGWTDDEIAAMKIARLTAVKLTTTILRVETAAVAAAAIVATMPRSESK